MMRIGHPVPAFRVPALVEGTLAFFDFASMRGRRVALSFLPPLDLLNRTMLERHAQHFDRQQAALLGVVPHDSFFTGPWHRWLWPRGLILLSDPLRRISRRYGIRPCSAAIRCQSFVIDEDGLLRYHLVHDLSDCGMSGLLEILRASRHAHPDSGAASELVTVKN